jgi:cellulose synthase/poly-beta-1,6-N-acetylglucosamine synthase-like glycosyltransferase
LSTVGLWFVLAPIALLLYSYLLYPLALWLLAAVRTYAPVRAEPAEWPLVSISVPVYNEAAQIAALLDSLLALDYPPARRQILVISDASDDGTDEVVRSYAARGIELLRMPVRGGKTAAENAAAGLLRGDIIVNTDASIRIEPGALRPLIATFADVRVGVASGRDVSVVRTEGGGNAGEAGYVGYEMGVRALETRVAGIVGASGCFYAIRSHLHREPLPGWLSRDFASALIARLHGYRAVSVEDAVCYVPRTTSIAREYRRKVRTLSRGMETLHHLRALLNPLRYGWFAWMLFSHKICRWLVPWSGLLFLAGLAVLSATHVWAAILLAASLAGLAVAAMSWRLQERRKLPRALSLAAFALAGNTAALHATVAALRGDHKAVWEPTRREGMATAGP